MLTWTLPAFAGDFIYLECETKTQVRAIDAKTAKVIREFEEEKSPNENNILKGIYKFDANNSQYTHHIYGNQKSDVQIKIDAKIKNGKLMHYGEGPRGHLETKILFHPPGKIIINESHIGYSQEGMYVGEFKTKDICKENNWSEFEKSLNQ